MGEAVSEGARAAFRQRWSAQDRALMQRALTLAKGVLGSTAPNPAVGCVIARDGAVLAESATQPGGRPHAEQVALTQAVGAARGASAYVSLEPCAHQGVTGPCAAALIDSGVARVLAACRDPDPRVAGKGLAMLEAAGVQTEWGLCEYEALAVNAGFFHRLATGRPLLWAAAGSTGFDAELSLEPGEDVAEALARLGGGGATRVFVRAGSPLETRARQAGFVTAQPVL